MTTANFSEMFRVFGRIGLMSFGGPAAQIGLMHRELVDHAGWLKEKEFLGALSFCMLLPGPEAMQLATYCGWKLRGTAGGLLAGLLFVVPGALLIFALAAIYAAFGGVPLVAAGFLGVKAAVVAIIVQALIRLAQRMLVSRLNQAVALGSFVALYTAILPFPAVIAGAAAVGLLMSSKNAERSAQPPAQSPVAVDFYATLRTIAIWGGLWATPIAALYLLDAAFLLDVALFFSKLAVVTFGGAYAVLAYMVQTVVQDFGWLSTGQMMDALGLAETTPGPLILVTQFVATLAGQLEGGPALAFAAGLTALWCTFTPCFLWIFAGAPHVGRILAAPRLATALTLISAAVVGVIVNLSLWFTMNLLFEDVHQTAWGALPEVLSFDLRAGVLVAGACGLLLWARLPLLVVLAISAVSGICLSFL